MSPRSHNWIFVYEEFCILGKKVKVNRSFGGNISFFFRVKIKPSYKPVCSRLWFLHAITELHGALSEKMETFIATAVKMSNPIYLYMFFIYLCIYMKFIIPSGIGSAVVREWICECHKRYVLSSWGTFVVYRGLWCLPIFIQIAVNEVTSYR